jgi:cell division protein DivIC
MKRRKKRNGSNRRGVLCITGIVAVLLISLTIQSHGLKEKIKVCAAQKATLEQQIAAEEKRSEEIDQLEEYKKTTEYVEEVAKDKLGLVYKDEIIFKPANP